MKKNKSKKPLITSVSFIHDPEAMQKWFEVYVQIVKKEVAKQISFEKD